MFKLMNREIYSYTSSIVYQYVNHEAEKERLI